MRQITLDNYTTQCDTSADDLEETFVLLTPKQEPSSQNRKLQPFSYSFRKAKQNEVSLYLSLYFNRFRTSSKPL